MADAADLSRFFDAFPMRRIASAGLDAALAEPAPERISILFLWGRDCPNCDIAKRAMLTAPARFRWPEVRWFHDNVYDDFDMATRFGLHGIPVFILFHGKRQLGRITSWPGVDEFADAVARQVARTAPGA
jgi:hypothetical protein